MTALQNLIIACTRDELSFLLNSHTQQIANTLGEYHKAIAHNVLTDAISEISPPTLENLVSHLDEDTLVSCKGSRPHSTLTLTLEGRFATATISLPIASKPVLDKLAEDVSASSTQEPLLIFFGEEVEVNEKQIDNSLQSRRIPRSLPLCDSLTVRSAGHTTRAER